jgi:phosphomannomutase
MGALLWEWLSGESDIAAIRMNCALDGRFPAHPPDPSKEENLRPLRERVIDEKADLGLAYDGDADRTVVVLSDGRIMGGGEMIAALVELLFDSARHTRFATCMMTARAVLEHFRSRGLDPVIVPVGHAKVKRIMHADASLVFGGEQSGHYYYREFSCCESSLMTTLLALRMRCEGLLERIASELSGRWVSPPKEASFPFERHDLATRASRAVARAAVEMFPAPREIMCEIDWEVARHCSPEDIERSEAIRADYPAWWFCIRPSATEPLVRLWVEAQTRDDRAEKEALLTDRLQSFLRG